MEIRGYIKFAYKEIVYFVVLVVYLIQLNILNKELLTECNPENPFQLLTYREYLPVKYFAVAVFLIIIAIILMVKNIKLLRRESSEFTEVIFLILLIVFLVIAIAVIIQFIDNPILRAIVVAGLSLFGVGYVMSQN